MKNEQMKSLVEVFICNKDGGCGEMGSKDLTDKLKKWAKEETDKQVRVYRSGCLGKCEEGIAIACFPEKKFILNAKDEDVSDIKKGLLEALLKLKT